MQALNVVVEAAAFSVSDKQRLTALLQVGNFCLIFFAFGLSLGPPPLSLLFFAFVINICCSFADPIYRDCRQNITATFVVQTQCMKQLRTIA